MFKASITWFLLFGWLSFLVTALPATTSPSIPTSLEHITLRLNNTRVDQLNASQIIHYSIPQTPLSLIIYTGNPISGLALRNTLDACLLAAHALMDKHGDVFMFPDPCTFTMPPKQYTGLEIDLHSTIVPGLKWAEVVNALNGVRQVMLQRAIYKEAQIGIYDEPSGKQIGIAGLARSSTVNLADHGALAWLMKGISKG